ncbi:hypothetical protein CDAR_377421 [Caerostris darwini]|uniref:Uncharacterized protein n=1 Tax=Caerostris darwini TaxID=1538125 RepID=A0AAV4W0A9_9ARAC|nr:hypothetical protein CDAR_377421 [Caerostris darwini]
MSLSPILMKATSSTHTPTPAHFKNGQTSLLTLRTQEEVRVFHLPKSPLIKCRIYDTSSPLQTKHLLGRLLAIILALGRVLITPLVLGLQYLYTAAGRNGGLHIGRK